MNGYRKLSKVCYAISGNVDTLLNGITSNELSKPRNAFLDRFGKLIALFEQKIEDGKAYIVLEEKYEEAFLEHIMKYARLANADVKKDSGIVIHVISPQGIGRIKFQQNLGYLALADELPDLPKLSEEEYNLIRLENNIPVQGVDFDRPMFLDTGLYDAVSFTKGCYLGQEVMARAHNLTRPARKIVRILYDSPVKDVSSKGEKIGQITTCSYSKKYGKYIAFAMIRKHEQPIDNGEIIREKNL